MTIYVTEEDIIEYSDFKGTIIGNPNLRPEEKARIIFDAYADWESGKKPSQIAREYNISPSTVYAWKNQAPEVVKYVKALEKRDLLPLTDQSDNLGFLRFIWLQTLLTGELSKDERREASYSIKINDDKKLLRSKETELKDFGIKLKNIDLNNYSIASTNSKDLISQGLVRLLLTTGLPPGPKSDYENLSIPEFIDNNILLFYLFKLRSYFEFEGSQPIISFVYLFSTTKDKAENTMKVFKERLEHLNYDFTYTIPKNSCPTAKEESFIPLIRLSKKSQVQQVYNLVTNMNLKLK